MPLARARTAADIRREIEAAEQRLVDLVQRWQASGTTTSLAGRAPTRETFDTVEELLRFQRGAIERLHQLWIEYAQAIGQHAPQ
jgi:hypothetical protein